MGKKKPTIKISKNHHHQEIKKPQLSISSTKVLKPKVYITHSSSFKTLVQQLTGNGSPVPSPAMLTTPPTPITHNNHNPRFQEHTLGFTQCPASKSGCRFLSSSEKEHTLGFTQCAASDSGCGFSWSPEKEHTLDELSMDNSSEGSVPTSSFGSVQEIPFDDIIPCMLEPFNMLYEFPECNNNFEPWDFATEDLCSYDHPQGVSVFDYDICCSYDDNPIQY